MFRPKRLLLSAGLLAVGLSLTAAAGWQAGRWTRNGLTAELHGRLEVYGQSLDAMLGRFDHLPSTAALDPTVARLAHRRDPALVGPVNDYLAAISRRTGAAALYLIGMDGATLAASNWDQPESFVGVNFRYRPYFQQAIEGGEGRFYGTGTLTGIPGYFIAAPVWTAPADGGRIVGVVVVKVLLDAMEKTWREAGDLVLLTDRRGVAFLSSAPDWKWRASRALDARALAELAETRQYGRADYPPLPFTPPERLNGPVDVGDGDFLLDGRALERDGWSLLVLQDAGPVRRAQTVAALGMALLLAPALAGWLAHRQRLRRLEEREKSRAALEQASADLERNVAERTADLSNANARLEQEVEQRRRTERELRDAQNELVQAAKLAALGQMAAGVTHELNQPLTALRGTAENCRALLDRGREDDVRDNLAFIADLVDRMAKITGQLRGFSRRSDGPPQPASLAAAVRDALALMNGRLTDQGVVVTTDFPVSSSGGPPASGATAEDSIIVGFEPVRLQQILVNLLRNAADALNGRADARIWVTATADNAENGGHDAGGNAGCRNEGGARLTVADNGPGVPPHVAPRLFEPFFTTKPAGEGLGLGLAISQVIAREYGAQLVADARPGGGARFTLTFPALKDICAAEEKEGDRAV